MTDATERAATEEPAVGAERAGEIANAVIENVEHVIVGNEASIERLVAAILGSGHVLLEDVPGVGKTMLARAVAASFECSFKRVQFTPDLLPADITGSNVYNRTDDDFEFRSGPIFANVVLGDEINRAPPKTQAAMLEAMEEQQVTAGGRTHALPDPFVVIATQNTIEREQTYELPAAELDRFMLKLQLGYPDADDEATVIERAVGEHAIEAISAVASLAELRSAQVATAGVEVREPIRKYVTRLACHTRSNAELGVSPRGSIALVRAAQGLAVLDSRSYVIPDDVQAAVPVVFPHRMRTTDGDAERIAQEAVGTVPVEQ
jgi:MoxR-like ATPase